MIDQYLSREQDRSKKARVKRIENIIHKFRKPHPLLRFVTKETIAFLFNIRVEQIYRVECWQHVVYVHAEGVSRFVSYADFPPVIRVDLPAAREFYYWRKRWAKKFKKRIAPEFWVRFYTNKFIEAKSQKELTEWGKLIGIFNFLFARVNIELLRENYSDQIF